MHHSFVDEAKIFVRSGDGGKGHIGFRREKYVPLGGPNGGDGGRGGDVIIVARAQLVTLLDYRFRPRQIAPHGDSGGSSQCTGADGETLYVPVPVGTFIYDATTDELLADLSVAGSALVVAQGGRGGKGNEHFKSSIRQAPQYAQPGEPGEERKLRFELKLLADVGLVGYPNVGKSSLIAQMSAARPKIADYPFTTLIPNLGVVRFGEGQHYIVADVPGLVEGAHRGVGLGSQFLRHIERVAVVVHLLTVRHDAPDTSPLVDFAAIEEEMKLYGRALTNLPRVLVLNQLDRPEVREQTETCREFAKINGLAFFALSAASGEGVRELSNFLGERIARRRDRLLKAEPPSDAKATTLSVAQARGALRVRAS